MNIAFRWFIRFFRICGICGTLTNDDDHHHHHPDWTNIQGLKISLLLALWSGIGPDINALHLSLFLATAAAVAHDVNPREGLKITAENVLPL